MKLSNYRLIGRGGCSTVYVAEQAPRGRLVAVRVVAGIGDPEDWYRFEDECLAAAALSDRVGIVAVHDVSLTPDGVGQVVTAYLEGGSLAGLLTTRGALRVGQAVGVGESVAIALAHAHADGIHHGDVKPSNLLVGKTGDVRLGDFGTLGLWAALRPTGDLSASPHIAPEILRGEGASASSDVYSLASTMYELVQGYSPFQRRGNLSAATMRARKLSELPRKPAAMHSPALTSAVMAALAPDPADRPTAAEFLDRLGECDMEPLFDRRTPVTMLALGPIVASPITGADEQPAEPVAEEAPPTGTAVEGPWAAHLAPGTTIPGPVADAAHPVPSAPATRPHRDRRKLAAVVFASVAAAAAVLALGIMALDGRGDADGTTAAAPSVTVAPLEPATAATVPATSPTTTVAAPTTGASIDPSASAVASSSPSSSAVPTTRPVVVTTAPRSTTTVAGTPTTAPPTVPSTVASTRPIAPVPPTAAITATTVPPTVTVGPVTPVPVTPVPPTAAPPATPAPTLAPATVAPPATQPPAVAPVVGSLSVNTGSSSVRAVASSADRCANSHWVLSGPVSYDQSSTAPSGCFSSAHGFDSAWYQLTLTPGSYRLSLTLTKNGLSNTTSSSFTTSG